ncbi:hypothetical protein HED34_11550 [Vagococcus fluvialis]|uniref:hypothetical protein n=1 Tax=Vagococcus fluvialis TaxID=2738 RepID=UPI001432DFF8|nr:hypothetical protein [Vagococcus fluvialis]NKC60594.1 hypothetical protein [Vagococcus fluvialis]NKD51422.1 hypothetical protein [Vagococcus fluvialis]
MSEKNERLGIKLSRDSVIALQELKVLMYGTNEIPVSDSFIIGEAYKEILEEINDIDWLKLNDKKIKVPGVTDNNDSPLTSMRTTLALDKNVYDGMKDLQMDMVKKTNGRVFFSFVVKIVLFAAILSKKGMLKEYIIK